MEIQYNNIKNVNAYDYKPFLRPSQTQNAPNVKINDLGYNYYTLIMYDPDAVHGTHWHWVMSNIIKANNIVDINKGNIVFDYAGPNPPDAKQHRYIFELYGSNKKPINVSFDSRNVTLEEGKKILGIQGNPILEYVFMSEREKNKGGSKIKTKTKTKKHQRTNKKSKYTKKQIKKKPTRI